ncbi:ABC transporter ATP-binding protein [Jannaschia rubra]|uniref:Stage 0 sporulation protein KD n=1 Tax=Jannaschia rubra TaxID=282197 RepID=A0A0M6XQM7_9RHOB|nr:ABC transporter ATP-binding protein [Jannaschia rubra]CTQ33440.1 Stage 0 sporulation protein KD [Jannaschia rubra]SFG01876.1 peptide/nickel transport system ATP-binding protein [Jannaschia rubra]
MSLISVRDLTVSFPTRDGWVDVVRDVSFDLGRERLGIVGESGSGKSQTGRALLGLTPPPGRARAERLDFDGQDLRRATARDWRAIRGRRIAMVMQDPKYSLNPVMTIGAQMREAGRIAGVADPASTAHRTLEAVQIRDADRVLGAYPHELSGGMGQRAMIAMMLMAEPEVLIADEPTSALDVTVQVEVLRILDDLVRDRGMGLVFISHDLRLVSTFCDRVLVMYAGKVVEELAAADLDRAKHPYTRGLLNCLPRLDREPGPLPTLDRQEEWAL